MALGRSEPDGGRCRGRAEKRGSTGRRLDKGRRGRAPEALPRRLDARLDADAGRSVGRWEEWRRSTRGIGSARETADPILRSEQAEQSRHIQ